MSGEDFLEDIADDTGEEPEVEVATSERLIRYYRANMKPVEVAARMGLTLDGLAQLEGSIMQDEHDYSKKVENAKHYKKAIAKEDILIALEKGDTRLAQWVLERTDDEYNPKTNVSVSVKDAKQFTDEEREKLLSMFPSLIQQSDAPADTQGD